MGNLIPTIELTNDFVHCIIEMERNGIKIDVKALDDLQEKYEIELEALDLKIKEIAQRAWGDKPINLGSPKQLSQLIFSRQLRDRDRWAEVFSLGSSVRNSVKKKKTPKRYDPVVFRKLINALTLPVYKERAEQCRECGGRGKAEYRLKAHFKPRTMRCKRCGGGGIDYIPTDAVAGFKQVPLDHLWVTTDGFSTSKDTLEALADGITGEAATFFKAMVRHNAVSSYLSTFVDGIRRNIRRSGLLHTNLLQSVSATGRLSSQGPNFQNQPRGNTFPVRRCIVSRWEGGIILEADWRQLEFRAAVELADDPQGYKDIAEGLDVHAFTAQTITQAGQPTNRQDAKPHTFKPLYGGLSGTAAEVAYYKSFLQKYARIAEWHDELCEQAVKHRRITLPTGREYDFPNANRYGNGSVRGATQIKNYPVQGFATADIAPVGTIEILRALRSVPTLRSRLILVVHDSNVLDVHPEEFELVKALVCQGLNRMPEAMFERYGLRLKMAYDFELKAGPNWLDLKEIKI